MRCYGDSECRMLNVSFTLYVKIGKALMDICKVRMYLAIAEMNKHKNGTFSIIFLFNIL